MLSGSVSGGNANFAFTQAPNPPAQSVAYSNLGDGNFTVSVSDNQPWLVPTMNGNSIVVNINTTDLARGTYNGTIQVSANPADTIGSPQTIHVQLTLLAGSLPNELRAPMFLPNVRR